MTAPVPPLEARARTQTWEEVEEVVAQFAAVAQTEVTLADFARAWLERMVTVLPASGGAVWSLVPGASAQTLARSNYSEEIELSRAQRWPSNMAEVSSSRIVAWDAVTIAQAVVRSGDTLALIVEVLLAPHLSPRETEGALRLVNVFCEIADDYLRRRELTELRAQAESQRAFQQFVLRIHGSLDPIATAYAVANDGRHWLRCDRVSVALRRGQEARVLAVSGVDAVDRRADEVRRLAALAAAVANSDEPLVWPAAGDEEHRPPQLTLALQAYLDRAHAQRLAALPLRGPQRDAPPFAVLVVEWFQECADPPAALRRTAEVARHSEVALQRAVEHDLPLLGVFSALGRLRKLLERRALWVLALVVMLTLIICSLTFIQTDFTIEAHGTLQPQVRRHLFAPANGVVETIAIEHGDLVAAGDELLQLRDAQFDFEFSRASGDLQTTLSRLATVRAKRSGRRTSETARDEEGSLAAEEEQLKQKLAGLQAQLAVLEQMRADLRLVSPIEGQVLTWHPRDLLESRPVKQGQLLLTVADPAGPWVLELRVDDQDLGHVRAARAKLEELPVTFLLATDPAETHRGTVEQIAANTEAVDGQSPSALVTVRLSSDVPTDARAGSGATARIHCGRRSLGYVWLHDLIDAVRTRVLF